MIQALHADYIIVSHNHIETNSVLIIENGIITDCIPFASYNNLSGHPYYYQKHSLLTAGFINCHTHLELSAFPQIDPSLSFTEWIMALVSKRQTVSFDDQKRCAIETLERTRKQGTIAFGDITNSGFLIEYLKNKSIPSKVFIEALGFQEAKAEEIYLNLLKKFETELTYDFVSLSPHAPYSISSQLMKKLKSNEKLQSIHIDESPYEREFLETGTGNIRTFLETIRVWETQFKIPKQDPYSYIETFDFLTNTLLVHSLNITPEDYTKINSPIILCPRSNAYLHHKTPEINKLVKNNLLCALGTDSLSSNSDLSILNEMKFIAKYDPISLPELYKLSTENGAKALHLKNLGTLEKNKHGVCNYFTFPQQITNPFDALISTDNFDLKVWNL